ncbi:hypothetical protein WJX77_006219 [Trebouxia sp. C0004]
MYNRPWGTRGNSARCGSAYVAARGVDGGLVRSADKDQCLARCQKDKKHDQSTGSKPLAAQPSSAHLQIFAAKQPPMLHEQQAIRSKVVELAGTMLTAEGSSTGVVPAAPGKTRTEDQQGTLQSMESGHPDQESRKLSESHAAQVLLKMQTATAQTPCRRSSKKAEPKAKKRRLCKGDQKCKAKAVAIMPSESEQEAESEDETESEDDPETYSSHEEDTDN